MEWQDYWLKAKENLEMAALADQSKKYNVCASRAYYAVFLASVAALIKLTDFRAKDNEWEYGQVQSELNRRLIMWKKVLPAELGRTPIVNLSQRRFIQLFRDEVGLTPKLFCRVQRFQEVIKTVEKRRDVDWVDIALSCGYFDQSHFNHDFREFSGLSPTEYLELRTEHLSHVLVRQ